MVRGSADIWGILKRLTSSASVPPELAEPLLLDQAKDFSYIMGAITLLGVNTVGLLFFDFLHDRTAPFRHVAMALVVLCYGALLHNARRWLRMVAPGAREAKAYFATMVRLLVVLGALWSVMLFVLVREANPGQLSLLYGIMVGCLATPVMVSPAICGIAYWAPVSVGILIALISAGRMDAYALLDLFAFILLTGFCMLYINRRLNERALGAIRLEENAELIKLLLRDFEESASDWLWETNAALELQPASQRLAQVARRPAEQLRGVFPDVLLGAPAQAAQPGSALEKLRHAIAERSPFRDLVVPVVVNGEERYWSLTGKPILDKQGRFAGYHGVGSDMTGQRRQQEQISFLARHDSLTKLPNRVLFSEALHSACDHCQTSGFALLCLDLDNFKLINDTLGHATGDAVLVAVAERLRGAIREFDMATRLGGDEFAAILMTDQADEAATVARRIIERMARPFQFDGKLVQIGVSIGIGIAPRDGDTPNQLMKKADLALYRAKADGRGTVRFYDPQMDERVQERRKLISALRHAVAHDELRLDFQPVIDMQTQRIIGAEALVRWQHPELGLLGPASFIPLAEETGLIHEIGDWVLREACASATTWPLPVMVAVNLSPLQFRDGEVLTSIDKALSSSGLPAARLEVEVVESVMLETSAETEKLLWSLRERGVQIALDDFGTGYSSLSYLRRFPFHKIKIDRSFIRDLGPAQDGSAIILAIIGLAQRMSMQVTAEGVETPEQAALLAAYGCTQAQGYLFHHPLPPAEFARVLAQDTPYPAGAPGPWDGVTP